MVAVFVEGVVIVGSILLAFGLQAWWDGRQEQIEEREIIERLISDVQADIQGIEQGLNVLPRKEQSLSHVDSVLGESDARPQDSVIFLNAVINGANYGWNQYGTRRTTFDELLGSGTAFQGGVEAGDWIGHGRTPRSDCAQHPRASR